MRNRTIQNRFSLTLQSFLIGILPLVFIPGRQPELYSLKLLIACVTVLVWLVVLGTLNTYDRSRIRRYGPDASSMRLWEANWLDALPVLLLFWVVVSYAFSVNRDQSLLGYPYLPEGVLSWGIYILVFYLFRHEGVWNDWLADIFLFSAMIVSAIGIAQFFSLIPPFGSGSLSSMMTTIGNRNYVGTYTTLVLPIAVWSWMNKGKWYHLLASSLVFLLMLGSLTRSAWLALAIWFPVLLLLEFSRVGSSEKRVEVGTARADETGYAYAVDTVISGADIAVFADADVAVGANAVVENVAVDEAIDLANSVPVKASEQREARQEKRQKFHRLLLFLLVMVIAFVVVDLLSGRVLSMRMQYLFREVAGTAFGEEVSARMNIWKAAFPLLFDRPMTGYGVDAFADVFYTLPGMTQKYLDRKSVV